MTVTLRQLLEESPKLEVARADEPIEDAMSRMLEHDYSQLPVVTGDDASPRAIGVISTTSIARACLHLGMAPSQLRVRHAIDRHPIRKHREDDLWRTLDEARDGEVLLVEDDDGALLGILTGHDFTGYLRQQSEDALTVRDVESTMKQLISDHFDQDELREVVQRVLGHHQRSLEASVRSVVMRCFSAASVAPQSLDAAAFKESFDRKFPDKTPDDFDRLTFSQYQQVLLGDPCWTAYKDAFDLPVAQLRTLLDGARELRNQMAHHRGLPTPAERAKLNYCRELLSQVADRRADATAEASLDVPDEPTPPTLAAAEPVESSGDEEDSQESHEAPSPLTTWLAGISDRDRVTLLFDSVAKQLPGGLPRAALEHRSWWTNDEEVAQASHWLDANWRVVSVNLTTNTVTFGRNTSREQACIAAFGTIFRQLEAGDWNERIPSPTGRPRQGVLYLSRDGTRAQLTFGFARGDKFRIALYIDGGDKVANKSIYDELLEHRDALERDVGESLTWERLAHRRASRVALYYPRPVSIRSSDAEIDDLAEWIARHAGRFARAMRERYEATQ